MRSNSSCWVQLASVQFHLINTTILFLSREGFRRGCLRAQQLQDASGPGAILRIAAYCIPLGAAVTLCVCAVALRGASSLADPYAVAILLQGRTGPAIPAIMLYSNGEPCAK